MTQNPPRNFGQAMPQDAPRCYRHPEVATTMQCLDCAKPICGQCTQPAQTGVRCPEHAAAQQNRQMAAPTAVGARQTSVTPTPTYTIMGICLAVFALQNLIPVVNWYSSFYGVFVPATSLAFPWTFITAGFMHGGIVHLLLNLYALYLVGPYLERTLGRWRYSALFLLSVIGGHVAVLLLANPLGQDWVTGTVGASGGLFGLFGALFVVQRRIGGQALQVLVLLGINFAFGFIYPNISWQGHLGGLLTGAALAALLFAFRPKRVAGADLVALAKKANLMHGAVVVAVLLALVALVAVKVLLVLA